MFNSNDKKINDVAYQLAQYHKKFIYDLISENLDVGLGFITLARGNKRLYHWASRVLGVPIKKIEKHTEMQGIFNLGTAFTSFMAEILIEDSKSINTTSALAHIIVTIILLANQRNKEMGTEFDIFDEVFKVLQQELDELPALNDKEYRDEIWSYFISDQLD